MNKPLVTFLLTSCLLSLCACSTSDNTKLFTPVEAKENMATVYIYRPTTMANAIYSPELHVNSEMKLNLKIGRNYLLTLPPGETTFEIEPDKNYTGTTLLTLPLKANDIYYLRIGTSLNIKNTLDYEPYLRSFSLVITDSKQAITEIAECCSQNNKKIIDETNLRVKSDKQAPDDGFSIDKTQNPFSH